ncbi:hypothetical protein [Streptomyces sp. NPDC054838]
MSSEPQDEENPGISPALSQTLRDRAKTPTEEHVAWEKVKEDLELE